MKINQYGSFKKAYKKLYKNQLAQVNTAIQAIIDNPGLGEQKKGDLSMLRVYKFQVQNQLTLIGYNVSPELTEDVAAGTERVLTFIDIGSHENFYRNIKKK
ncbi:MAG: type II toxin-antitoxin system RelE/ParE family toxin [Treponema sp.]|jgi:mRNA-degrading endonuclease YafQ of YafQ-DinJ toxin-antitoxin module|nr:type II toxin-antitoxin system RelE/ParE family toxin [Treponema sp.]